MNGSKMKRKSAVLLLSCPDRKGVVASISGFVFQHGGNILHADEHSDVDSGSFLMRVEFDPAEFDIPLNDFAKHFSPIAIDFDMRWRLAQSDYRPRMAILVSKYDHCIRRIEALSPGIHSRRETDRGDQPLRH